MEKDYLPKISVVTVVLNNYEQIEDTITSVINQTYSNIEYIIIDGGSTDGTLEVIERYKSKIAIFISEADKGLYDAMNKGTNKATGDWIIYMNSGDRFYNENVLSRIFVERHNIVYNKVAIFSDTITTKSGKEKKIKTRYLKHIWRGAPSVHQSQLVKTEIAKKYPFDLKYKINADYDFIYKVYKEYEDVNSFLYLYDIIISKCNGAEGVSKTVDPKFTLTEHFNVSKKYSNYIQTISLFFLNSLKYLYSKINNRKK